MVLVLKGNVAAGLRLSRASACSVALGAGCGTGGEKEAEVVPPAYL